MAEFTEPQNDVVDDFTPDNEVLADPADELSAVEEIDPFDEAADLVIEDAPLDPLGKSWAYDFGQGRFYYQGQRGPTPTFGLTTLRYWVEKCLTTERGASPIYDQGYGLEDLSELIGEQPGVILASLRRRVTEALTFHPHISDVADFDASHFPGAEVVEVSFTVVTDEGEELVFDGLSLEGRE